MATLKDILERIEDKKADYSAYNFTQTEDNALTAFFDLAQEFEGMEDLYCLCVAIPKGFFGLEARLYVINPRTGELMLNSSTEEPDYVLPVPPPEDVRPKRVPYYTERGSLVLTIRGKKILIEQLPFKTRDNVLGLLEIYPAWDFGAHHELFFEKYANRIGFNIHNRLLVEKNIEHLRFIRSLVADIEHNIIVPNMVYKLFLRNLKGKISKGMEAEKLLGEYPEADDKGAVVHSALAELSEVNRGLASEFENIEKHYRNMSLFLETLLRRSHFDKGRLTLRIKPCNMNNDVVKLQLERFADRFRTMGISVDDRFSGIPEEEVISVVDVGLMAQVYANFFSNALKYTEEMTTETGQRMKSISYGREIVRDFFGPGKDGIKYNVYSTGPHVPHGERERIFEDEYRGSNAMGKPGTGHGLAFIKNVVELHGGVFGYEPTQYGNNFYFILPR